ncbi:putative odorant receptor 59c [Drosophila tropicalis]|uniref:putative odorant receptor 59c n=1 Tax=Drosophila tropicalis TaxID=46794 RepID=UPI0035AC0566
MKWSLFKRLKAAPLSEKVKSIDACVYFYRSMTIIGWLPPEKGPHRWLYLLWTANTILWGILYLPCGLFATYFVHFDKFTPNEFLTSLQVDLNAFGNTVKACVTFSQIWRLKKMNELIAQLDEHCVTPTQREKLHNTVAWGNRTVLFYATMYIAFTTSTLLSSVFAGSPPWQLFNPLVDWRQGVGNLWLASLMEYFFMCIVVIQEQQSDTFPIVFSFLFRGHLAILKDRIENLRADPQTTNEQNYEQLVTCIKDHKIILECCDIMRPMISATIFTQFMLIGMVLGLAIINIFFFSSSVWTAVANISFVFALLLETFPFCMNCELLIDDCQALTDAIFHSNWMDADRRYKSALVYFLHRVQQPIQFMAGAIFPISMQSNIAVAKFAFSIITIVNQMNLGEKFREQH